MTEPATPTAVAAPVAGAALAGLVAGVSPEAAAGALCGALVFFISAREHPIIGRLLLFMVSFVMGVLFAPAMAGVSIPGIGPVNLPGPAAFVASTLVVTVSLAAIRSRGLVPSEPE